MCWTGASLALGLLYYLAPLYQQRSIPVASAYDPLNLQNSVINQCCITLKNQFLSFFFFLYCPLFCEGCGGSSSRLSRHTSRSSITSIISLGEAQAIPSKILNVIFSSSSRLSNWSSPNLLWQVKLVWGVFLEAFCLHGQTI